MITVRRVSPSESWWPQWGATCPSCHDVTVHFYRWSNAVRWADEHARAHLGWNRYQPNGKLRAIQLTHGQVQEAINKLTNTELGGHLTRIYPSGRTIVAMVIESFVYRGQTFPRGCTFMIDAGEVLDYND